MVIIVNGEMNQKMFNRFWCPLMYKHQECKFYFNFGPNHVYPKDLTNLHVNSTEVASGPILKCEMNKIPTYRGMIELQKKDKSWIGEATKLGDMFVYDLDSRS